MRRKHNIRIGFVTFIAGIVLTLAVLPALAGTDVLDPVLDTSTPVEIQQVQPAPAIDEVTQAAAAGTFSAVYDTVSPSVVAISVLTRTGGGSGSGFVIDQRGHIVTNNHVVDGAQRIEVEFFDGLLAEARIVGADPDSDLAVLRVDISPDRLLPVTFADSEALDVGQPVLAIGSPFGQRWTLTSGIISALGRTISGLGNFSIGGVIQTDAAINPGNSGGPLLDLNGHVIGVNSQILSGAGSNAGVGFAVPANLTQRVARELIENGEVDYSYIGIQGGDVTLSLIQALGLPDGTRGVVVGTVFAGGPAARAGLQSAGETVRQGRLDIITAIDGQPLRGMEELITYLANNTRPGQTVTLSVIRNGRQRLEIPVTLQSRA